MTDMSPLKNNAIVRNASTGPQPAHGPVKTGELSQVLVKPAPVGPKIQEGQQRPVQIMAPNSRGATIGQLPMVQVKMTSNGPQLDDGRGNSQSVIIRDTKPRATANALPMVQVSMTSTGPQVSQALPAVQSAPPQIRAVAPAQSSSRVPRIAVPATVPASSPLPELTEEQLMLCRHAVDKFVTEARGLENHEEYVVLGESTISALDQVMAAQLVRDTPPIAATPTIAATAATSISPTPSVSYTAGRVGTAPRMQPAASQPRGFTLNARGGQRHGGLAPRRTTARRPGDSALPMVEVRMDGKNAQVQNVAEYQAAREAALSPQPEIEVVGTTEVVGTPEVVSTMEVVGTPEVVSTMEVVSTEMIVDTQG